MEGEAYGLDASWSSQNQVCLMEKVKVLTSNEAVVVMGKPPMVEDWNSLPAQVRVVKSMPWAKEAPGMQLASYPLAGLVRRRLNIWKAWEVVPSPVWSVNTMVESFQDGFSEVTMHPGALCPVGPSRYAGVMATGLRREPLTRSGEVQSRGAELLPTAVNVKLDVVC